MEDVVSHRLLHRSGPISSTEQKMQTRLICQMLLVVGLFLIGSCSCSQVLDGPLFSGVTSFTVTAETSTVTKATPCFITFTSVSQCRRKRGIEERPLIIQEDNWEITPSAVIGYITRVQNPSFDRC
jgi:hypothetical protein